MQRFADADQPVNAEVYMKKARPPVKNPPDDYPVIEKRLREEVASNQRWHRIDRQLDRMDHRIDRLDRTLQFFDQTNKRMTQLLDTLEARSPRKAK